jgi:predicted dehydrogenase
MRKRGTPSKVRYAVVGQGYIAQVAILPAFAHARRNSELAALVSGDRVKRKALGRKYGVAGLYSYEAYDECLRGGGVDAVFIALPNHLHRDYAVRAARAGVHVLCEKPMAMTEADCKAMIAAARRGRVKLMVAYRLHFEEANLKAAEMTRSGKLGEPRIFDSLFTMQVKAGNIRVQGEGGGALYDIGVYCINAARALFAAEPVEVFAWSANNGERRFREVDEMTAAVMRFPGERLATFTWTRPTGTPTRSSTTCRRAASRSRRSSASETSSRPSCCISRTASCGTGSRSLRVWRAWPTSGSSARSCARRARAGPCAWGPLPGAAAPVWPRRSSGRRCASLRSSAPNRRLPE